MSLNWDWNHKLGEITYEPTHPKMTAPHLKHNLYRGNAFCIAICEDTTDDTYTLEWFAADKQHFKNLCGLNPPEHKENCILHFRIQKLRLNTRYKETQYICKFLAQSQTPITIELYHE